MPTPTPGTRDEIRTMAVPLDPTLDADGRPGRGGGRTCPTNDCAARWRAWTDMVLHGKDTGSCAAPGGFNLRAIATFTSKGHDLFATVHDSLQLDNDRRNFDRPRGIALLPPGSSAERTIPRWRCCARMRSEQKSGWTGRAWSLRHQDIAGRRSQGIACKAPVAKVARDKRHSI